MKALVLWSDILIYLLVSALFVFFVLVRRNEPAKQRWLNVFQNPIGSLSFIIILFYVLIALLDSIHYRTELLADESAAVNQVIEKHYSHDVASVLDWVLSDLKNQQERTYSAPFSPYAFVKENMQDAQGLSYRDYPRLKFGGAHLKNINDRAADIAWLSFKALAWGLLCGGFIVFCLHQWKKRSDGESSLPWSVIYGCIIVLVILVSWILQMSAHYHILGTDKVGTDVLYQSIKAVRTGVLIGSLATLLTLPFAIVFGISAGYFKGKVDDVIQFIYTTLISIPDILLIAAAVLVLDVYIQSHAEQFELLLERSDFKFLTLCFILGITSWTGLCRLLRAESLKVSQLDYVQAAVAFGVNDRGIIFRHILPNVMHLVLISMVLNFSGFVLAEAVLSYIGVGVDASMFSWGNMINAARQELSRDPTVWWTISAAFVWMFVLVLAANLFSDQVREAFDPRVFHKKNTPKKLLDKENSLLEEST